MRQARRLSPHVLYGIMGVTLMLAFLARTFDATATVLAAGVLVMCAALLKFARWLAATDRPRHYPSQACGSRVLVMHRGPVSFESPPAKDPCSSCSGCARKGIAAPANDAARS